MRVISEVPWAARRCPPSRVVAEPLTPGVSGRQLALVLRADISVPASLHPRKVLVQRQAAEPPCGASERALAGKGGGKPCLALGEVASSRERKGSCSQMWSHEFHSFPLRVAAELAQGQHLGPL